MAEAIAHLDKDGATLISGKALANILAGTTGTAYKLGVRNIGTRDLGTGAGYDPIQIALEAVLSNDGITHAKIKKDVDTLSRPWGVTAAAVAGAGTFTPGTYGIVVVAKKGTGRTTASAEVTATVSGTQEIQIDWTEITENGGADGYLVYGTDTPGTYGANSLIADIGSGATVTFTWDGTAPSAGTPATANTTGGVAPDYGTPPAGLNSATSPFTIGQDDGTLEMNEEAFYWINRVVPSNAAAAGNPRLFDVAVTEGA